MAAGDLPVLEQSEHSSLIRHRGLYVLLILILCWSPIPIGSNRGWSSALLEAGTLFVAGAWAFSYSFRPFEVPVTVRDVRSLLVILVLWTLYPLLQLIPISVDAAEIMGGSYGAFGNALAQSIDTNSRFLTLDRNATFAGFIRQCSLVALFFSVLALTSTESRLRGLLVVMLVVGFMEAFYGLLLYFGGEELGLWNPGQLQTTVSGTYVNQNHFAGLLELTIPAGLGLLLSFHSRGETSYGVKKLARGLSTFMLGPRTLILFLTLVMIGALIMTASRGGIGALAVGIFVAVSIAVWKKGIRARELTLGLLTVAVAVIAVLWLGSSGLSNKLQTVGFSSDRADLRDVSYQMIGDNATFGTGVGTYRWVFPAYKDERFGIYFYEHAHNDILELLIEQGIVGFSLLALGLSLLFFRIVKAYGRGRDPLIQGALFASIAGCVAFLVHGLVDFNFQIPANAVYFFALLGLGTVASSLHTSHAIEKTVAGRDLIRG
jgi:putative inorganic carbon (HCO3(-)) transporter